MKLSIDILTGNELGSYIEITSQLRIKTFKEYPYLYQGELDYERQYMQGYTTDAHAMIAVAKIENAIVGISTGIPLISNSEIVSDAKKIFSENGIDITDHYYYGETIILPEFRGKSITTKLYDAQDKLIKSWGYKNICFLTVIREDNHPLKPKNYQSPDKMWEHLGFVKTNFFTRYHWPTIQTDGSVIDTNHEMEFWTKKIQK